MKKKFYQDKDGNVKHSDNGRRGSFLFPYPLNVMIKILPSLYFRRCPLEIGCQNERGYESVKENILYEVNVRRRRQRRTPIESYDTLERWLNEAIYNLGDARMWIKLRFEAHLTYGEIAELMGRTLGEKGSCASSRLRTALWNLEIVVDSFVLREPYQEEDIA